jgi:hypothetical protein
MDLGEIRRQILQGNQTALALFWRLTENPDFVRRWLEQFGMRVQGDDSPFARSYMRYLALYNATGLLPVQNITITIRPGDTGRYGAYTTWPTPRSIEVVYNPRYAGDSILAAHEAAHAIQTVAANLYGVDRYNAPSSETFAQALAYWIHGLYTFSPAAALAALNRLASGAGDDWWYRIFQFWPLPRDTSSVYDLRNLLKISGDRDKFEKMLRDVAKAGEEGGDVGNLFPPKVSAATNTTAIIATTAVSTATSNMANISNTATNVVDTFHRRGSRTPTVTVTTSADQNKTSVGTSGIIVSDQSREAVDEALKALTSITTQMVEDKTPELPDIIKRYATESKKVVIYAERWPGYDFKANKHVEFEIAWYGSVVRDPDGEEKLVIEGACSRVIGENEWRCKSPVIGIPASVSVPVKIIHKGNVVMETTTSDLWLLKSRGIPLDLKHGKGTPWDRLSRGSTTAQNTQSGSAISSVSGRIAVSNAPGGEPSPAAKKLLEELGRELQPFVKAVSDFANQIFGVFAELTDRGEKKFAVKTPFGTRYVSSPEEARKAVEADLAKLPPLPPGYTWIAESEGPDKSVLRATIWYLEDPSDASTLKPLTLKAVVDKKTGEVKVEGLPDKPIYIFESSTQYGGKTLTVSGYWWDPKTGKASQPERIFATPQPPDSPTAALGGAVFEWGKKAGEAASKALSAAGGALTSFFSSAAEGARKAAKIIGGFFTNLARSTSAKAYHIPEETPQPVEQSQPTRAPDYVLYARGAPAPKTVGSGASERLRADSAASLYSADSSARSADTSPTQSSSFYLRGSRAPKSSGGGEEDRASAADRYTRKLLREPGQSSDTPRRPPDYVLYEQSAREASGGGGGSPRLRRAAVAV